MTFFGRAPVLVLTYRKPDFLSAIYESILQYGPSRVYVAHNTFASESERIQVLSVREAVRRWEFPCEIVYIFHDHHLDINTSLHHAIDYAFSREESLIILEDDTIPATSFFRFCNGMLDRHRNDDGVGAIIGSNLGVDGRPDTYFQSEFSLFYWGWATWASRWKLNGATDIPWGDTSVVSKLLAGADLMAPFLKKMSSQYIPWDIRWGWVLALNHQRCVMPGRNLVSNRGFVPEGTYTNFIDSRFRDIPAVDDQINAISLDENQDLVVDYQRRIAALIREILQKRGELGMYGLTDVQY